ncbi:hypothetical protein [Roseiconus lacunae]|uniref:hypothetical protein n=1 Tax=Roseiconus lacunae TaxID=2605694 RepID=UPI001E553989|nr:hypothetical protein [Roseiconus lacunae]MCD0459573.1 hypothetical protein [Roseiconus lacunae]
MNQLSVVPMTRIEPEKDPATNHEDTRDFESSDHESLNLPDRPPLVWDEQRPAAENYARLARLLTQQNDLFRVSGHDCGIMLVRSDGSTKTITNAAELAPLIVDRVSLSIYLGDKPKGTKLSNAHLNAMLKTEAFLSQFPIVNGVTKVPVYLPDFSLSQPGYNDGGEEHRYVYVGQQPLVLDTIDCVEAFLDAMDFDTESDRANALAACITVMLWNHWPGGKPIILATASKSHAGKDTIIAFASGLNDQCSISYQGTDWALERSLVGAINYNPEARVVVIENARLDRRGSLISSAIIERFATDPNPFLFSTGTGPARRRRNDFVLAISTNFGSVSEDILNRSLPIHLDPVGHVADRVTPIGNPKLEFLPANRELIAAELRGMIERWKVAGMPLDEFARHPFSEWAATVGGILKVNGIDGFLANYGKRRVADDPVRSSISLLGASVAADEWHRADSLTRTASTLGILKQMIPSNSQETFESRKRGLGVVLSAHQHETFLSETDSHISVLRLEKGRRRFEGEAPHIRYRFVSIDRSEIPCDES